MKIMSTSSGISDSEDSCRDQYEPIRKLAMVQIQPPRNPNKPFTSFCIKDILSPNNVPHQRNFHFNNCSNSRIVRPWDIRSSPGRDSELSSDAEDEEINVDDDEPLHQIKSNKVSPLDALMEMANKTFEGLETAETAGKKLNNLIYICKIQFLVNSINHNLSEKFTYTCMLCACR